MGEPGLIVAILALAAGTFAMRLVPMAVLSRVEMPEALRVWLRLVPGAVLAASLAQSLVYVDGALALHIRNPYLLAAVPAFVVAWRTRSVLLTMLAGMVAYALLGSLL